MKDHLGNVRLTFTTKEETDKATATLKTIDTGEKSSVRAIDMSDNRGAGSSIRHQIKDLPDGTMVKIVPQNVPPKKD